MIGTLAVDHNLEKAVERLNRNALNPGYSRKGVCAALDALRGFFGLGPHEPLDNLQGTIPAEAIKDLALLEKQATAIRDARPRVQRDYIRHCRESIPGMTALLMDHLRGEVEPAAPLPPTPAPGKGDGLAMAPGEVDQLKRWSLDKLKKMQDTSRAAIDKERDSMIDKACQGEWRRVLNCHDQCDMLIHNLGNQIVSLYRDMRLIELKFESGIHRLDVRVQTYLEREADRLDRLREEGEAMGEAIQAQTERERNPNYIPTGMETSTRRLAAAGVRKAACQLQHDLKLIAITLLGEEYCDPDLVT